MAQLRRSSDLGLFREEQQNKKDHIVRPAIIVILIIFKNINVQSMSNAATSLNSFIPMSKIGQGTYSSVYQVRRITDQQIYALKKIKIISLKEKQKANALNQIRILASLTSNYIISYKEAFFDQKLHLLCIVMEWANQGDLLKKIVSFRERKHKFPQQEIWKAAYQILSGLHTLHRNSILHRDMKSANIFICDGVYKLGDLNVSKVNDHQQSLVKTQTGTPFYASPEIWRDEPYGSQSDIWSFGIIIYEMCCLKPPFNGKDLSELYKTVQQGRYQPIPRTYSKELAYLIERCLNPISRQRPSAQELLREGELIRQRCEFYEIPLETNQQLVTKEKLLATIKMPYDLKKLNSKLPSSKYDLSPEEQDKQKTMIKSSHESYMLHHSDRKKQIPSGQMHRARITSPKDEYLYAAKRKESVPEQIKNHLNRINKITQERPNSYKNSGSNTKNTIQPSLNRKIPQNKLSDYLTPIKELTRRKQRPLSCNYLNNKQKNDHKSPYHIHNLNKYQYPSIKEAYMSQRKPILGLRRRHQLISDRKDGIGQIDPYLLEKNKYRCRSANPHEASSALADLKHRLQLKYNQPILVGSSSSDGRSLRMKQHIKSQASLRSLGVNYSQGIQNSINSYQYRNPTPGKNYRFKKNESNYLQEVQSKILLYNRKMKISEHLLNYKGDSDTKIRRIIKGSNYLCKSSNRL